MQNHSGENELSHLLFIALLYPRVNSNWQKTCKSEVEQPSDQRTKKLCYSKTKNSTILFMHLNYTWLKTVLCSYDVLHSYIFAQVQYSAIWQQTGFLRVLKMARYPRIVLNIVWFLNVFKKLIERIFIFYSLLMQYYNFEINCKVKLTLIVQKSLGELVLQVLFCTRAELFFIGLVDGHASWHISSPM